MRALWGKAPFQYELRELPTPKPGIGQVLVRIGACGICGTDLHMQRAMNRDWTPLGHELAGVVEQVGQGVTLVQTGDRVIVENNTGCGVCDACKNGESRYCRNISSFMNDQAGFGDYLCVAETSVQKYRDLTPRQAALAEPLTVAIDVALRADIPLNAEVAVWGAGPIGIMACKIAKLRGARRVFLVGSPRQNTRNQFRMELAHEFGADVTIGGDEDVAAALRRFTRDGIDRALVTAPPPVIPGALRACRFGGIIALIGLEEQSGQTIPLDINAFHFQKLQLRASHAIPNHFFPIALDLLARRVVDADKLITHTFSLDEYLKAFSLASNPNERVGKVTIEP
ncbi:MAG: alcohol dehydrogenase catalytic domain-containing protein [Anaerolineae bacterium]|nr:alcohol dehydrogenase catalytic domain-containing protein [Anaerolineae bacterium]